MKKKMNLKTKLRNKATLIALIGAIIAFVYQILGIFSVVPSISEAEVTNIVGILINILAGLGILIDPNTPGIFDGEE